MEEGVYCNKYTAACIAQPVFSWDYHGKQIGFLLSVCFKSI